MLSTRETSDFLSAYSSDLSDAEIRSKLTGLRMFMMSSNAWAALRNELYKRFSSGADVILFEMGRSYGSELVASLAKSLESGKGNGEIKLDPRDFSRLVTMTGWGRANLSGDLEIGTHLSVVVTNCVFCEDDGNFDHKCPFLRGVSIGIASSFYKREFGISVTCFVDKSRELHHVCKFELSRK